MCNIKIYLKIYYLGCDNAAELQYSFFISISIVYVMQYNSTSFALKLRICDSATRLKRVQSLVTHGVTDKATYLSKATK